MNRNAIITIVVVLVVLAAGYLVFTQTAPPVIAPDKEPASKAVPDQNEADSLMEETEVMSETSAEEEDKMMTESMKETEPMMEEEMMTKGAVREFNVSGSSFKFSLNELRVKKGETVRINYKVEQGFHDWVIDEFNARTKQMAAGGEQQIEFVADKNGSFEYYCSVGNHRQLGMVGRLIVE